MEKIHLEISRRIGTLDFGRLAPGFHPFRFALYNNKKVCFGETEIPWDSRFVGNTAIDYNNETIAIWGMKYACTDMDIFTSLLVHEMLHAYQRESGTVFPDDLVGVFYPRNLDNFTLRYRENQLLAGLAEKFDATAWADFKAIRAYRRQRHEEAVDYEIKTENIEGRAQFVELGALKQLSPDLYSKRLARILSALRSPEKIFDARLISYDTGSLIRMVIVGNNLDHPAWAEENPCTAITAQEIPGIREEFEKYFGATDKKVQELLSNGEKLDISGKKLTSFDPYNVRSSGNYLYHPNFIGVTTDGEKPDFFAGTFITKMASYGRTIEEAWRAGKTTGAR
jgi:hypothetical protein